MSLTDCLTNKPFEEQKTSKDNYSWLTWSIMNWSYFVVICIFHALINFFPGCFLLDPWFFSLQIQISAFYEIRLCLFSDNCNIPFVSEKFNKWKPLVPQCGAQTQKTFLFSSLSPDGIMTWGKIVSLRWHHWWSSNYIASTHCPHIKLGCRLHKSFIRFQDPFILGSLKYLGVNQPK